MRKLIWIAAPIVLLAAAAGTWSLTRSLPARTAAARSYETATIGRASIEATVSSSGTLEPVSTVSVLSQMSGRVEKVSADYNDRVHKGDVLVSLNTDMLKLQEQQSKAAVSKAKANRDLAALDLQNKEKLAAKALISDYDLKSTRTALDVASAELASAEAALRVIQTQLNQYALITSPIDGIVLKRNVDAGQSVVEGSSSNASSLFTLAEDLAHMEIEADVDELDIAAIRVGQAVRFSVEAIPARTFAGVVGSIRLVPETTNNVVSYTVIVKAENSDGSLLPGMTASVTFIKERKDNVLAVPSAAFRFQPASLSAAEIAKRTALAGLSGAALQEAETRYDAQLKAQASSRTASTTARPGGLTGMIMPGPFRRPNNGNGAPAAAAAPRKTLWTVGDGGELEVLAVHTGTSDGKNTELIGADQLEGRQIIVRERTQ